MSNIAQSNDVVHVYNSFMNGERFLELSESEKSSYVMGILDGYSAAPIFGTKADEKKLTRIHACIDGKTNTQISAIFTKYLKDNPDKWHLPASVAMYNTLNKVCGK
jgi:GrpB-like predicted nucleotidyltransferase (UPF0157 family)